MDSQKNYKSFWNDKAATPGSAFIAVDGSTNEETARLTGTYSGHQVSAALDLQPTDRVLELGCGVGRIGREIAPKVAHWEGTDISSNMIEVARERLAGFGNVGFTELSRSSLQPLADASFDKAYCVAVFIHMDKEDFFLYLEEMARILKPGGLLYFDTWNMASEVGWRRYALEIDQYRHADHAKRKDVARNQFSCPEEVRILLDRAGFDLTLMLADSPWVQAIGVRRGSDSNIDALRKHAQSVSARVAYSPLWTQLFAGILDVAIGKTPPMQMWEVACRRFPWRGNPDVPRMVPRHVEGQRSELGPGSALIAGPASSRGRRPSHLKARGSPCTACCAARVVAPRRAWPCSSTGRSTGD